MGGDAVPTAIKTRTRTPETQLRWLLDFAERDLNSLSYAQQTALLEELDRIVIHSHLRSGFRLRSQEFGTITDMCEAQPALRECLETLAREEHYERWTDTGS
jgi:hypothetical protein